jgi:murein DD-endopeptidase MepM/ murein hydrolase activator NlpD
MRRISMPTVRIPRLSRRLRAGAAFLLVIPLLFGVIGTSTSVTSGDDLSSALAQQKALEARIAAQKHQVQLLSSRQAAISTSIDTATKNLDSVNANLSVVQGQVNTLAADIQLVRASIGDLVNQVTAINAQLATLEKQETLRETALIQRKQMLADHIRAAWETSQTSLLEQVLSSHSFSDVLTQISDYVDFGQQDQALATQIAQDVRDIATLHQAVFGVRADTIELQNEVTAQKLQLNSAFAKLSTAKDRLKSLQDAAKTELANEQGAYNKLAQNKSALAAAIRKATAAKAALAKKIAALVAAQQNQGTIPSVYNGTLEWPMNGSVSQEFGCTGVVEEPPLGNCAHFHQGIDIVAPYGTPIHAAGPGVVEYVGWNYADGYDPAWIVIIAHSASLQTWYAHMQPLFPNGIHQGSPVSAGEVIGFEGLTGHTTGAHLHWAVMLNGQFVNPRLFL